MQEPTADLIWPALALVFAGVFLGLWRTDPVRRHLLGFAAGFFALFLAMAAHIAFPALNTATTIPILHGLACLSVIAIVWGSANRLGQKTPLVAMLVVTLVSGALIYFALETGNSTVALLAQNGGSGLLFATGAISLWLARPMSFLDRVLIWTMASIAAFGLVRPVVMMLTGVAIAERVQRKVDFNALSLVVMTALTVVLAMSLIAIAIREAIEIRHRANRTDPVSGFLDRATFDHASEAAIGNAHRLGLPVTLAVFEIDRFESFKAEWGQETSNLIVRDLSDILRACQRDGDIVGRIGESQFGVLLIGMNADSGLKLALDLRAQAKRAWIEMVTGMMDISLSCSIVEGPIGQRYAAISHQALSSLKDAKTLGSNCIVVNGREFKGTELGQAETEAIVVHG